MRSLAFSVARAALGFSCFACAVYEEDMRLPSELDGAGAASSLGGTTTGSGGTSGATSTGPSSPNGRGGALAGDGGDDSDPNEHAGGSDGEADGGEPPTSGGSGASDTGGSGGAQAGNGGVSGGNGGAPAHGGNGGSPGSGGAGGGQSGGGSPGSAGSTGTPSCADLPITPKSDWSPTVSHFSPANPYDPASNLLDGTVARWSTGEAQAGNEWIQIDFGKTVSLRSVNLQQGSSDNDYPRGYEVRLSNQSKNFNAPIRTSGAGTYGVTTTIVLPTIASGRYLLIKQTATSLAWWSILELEVSCY